MWMKCFSDEATNEKCDCSQSPAQTHPFQFWDRNPSVTNNANLHLLGRPISTNIEVLHLKESLYEDLDYAKLAFTWLQ